MLNIDTYDNMFDMVRKCRDGHSDVPEAHRHSKVVANNASWVSTRTLDEACDRALYGWPEGLARINKHLIDIEHRMPGFGYTKSKIYAYTGPGTVSGSRLLMGHPKFMRKSIKVPADNPITGKTVHLYFNYAISAGVGEDERFRVGARIVALIERLEILGNRCELTIINGNRSWTRSGAPHEYHIVTTVKRAGEPLSMENIAFILCSRDMDRRLAFSLMEQWPDNIRRIMNCPPYGSYPAAVSWYPPEALTDPWALKVDAQSGHYGSSYKGNPDAWLLEQLKKFGITFIDAPKT